MNAKNFYEKMRKLGLTDKITASTEPDYNLPFYQGIFQIMEGYAIEVNLNLQHHFDTTKGLWATDRPDVIPVEIKDLFFEI